MLPSLRVRLWCRFLGRRRDGGAACSGRRRRSAQARSRGRCGPRVRRSLWGFADCANDGGERRRRSGCPVRCALIDGSSGLFNLIGLGWCLGALRVGSIELVAADASTVAFKYKDFATGRRPFQDHDAGDERVHPPISPRRTICPRPLGFPRPDRPGSSSARSADTWQSWLFRLQVAMPERQADRLDQRAHQCSTMRYGLPQSRFDK